MDSCPTSAIIAPMHLDARKCLSYLTIETKEAIPEALTKKLSNRLVGCDICQEVCPWNSKAHQHDITEFHPKQELLDMTCEDWKRLEKPVDNKLFKKSAVQRAGFDRIKRTLGYLFG